MPQASPSFLGGLIVSRHTRSVFRCSLTRTSFKVFANVPQRIYSPS